MKWAVLITAIILIIPLATAVSDVRFEVDGQQLTHIGNNQPVQGMITFRASVNVLQVRFTGASIQGQNTGVVEPNTCEGRCSVPVTLRPGPQTTFTAQKMTDAGIVSQEITLQFQLDETPPTIANLQIGTCTQGCSIGPTPQNISFRVIRRGSPVLNNSIQITSNGNPLDLVCEPVVDATSCSVELQASSNQELVITAQDAAGNIARERRSLQFDAAPPEILGAARVDQGTLQSLAGGQQNTLVITVSEPLSATARFESDSLTQTGTCQRNDQQNLECRISITPTNERQTIQGTIIVTDAAGNEARQPVTLEIYESDSNTETNFWTVTGASNTIVEPHTWAVHDKTIGAALTLQGPQNARPIRLALSNCRHPALGASGAIEAPTIVALPATNSRSTTFDVTLRRYRADTPPDFDSLKNDPMTCNLQITSRLGDVVYTVPEQKEIEIPFRISQLSHPHDEQVRQIEGSQKRIDERTERIQGMQLIMRGAQTMCGVQPTMSAAGGALSAGAGVLLVTGVGTGAAEGMQRAANQVTSAQRGMQQSFGKLCSWVSCNDLDETILGGTIYDSMLDPLANSDGRVGTAFSYFQALGGAQEPSQLVDPYQSIYTAYAMQCLPAIMYHWQTDINIDCQYQTCVQQASQFGFTPQECMYNRDYQQCMLTAGHVYGAVPYTNAWSTVVGSVQDAFANPLSLLGGGASVACGSNSIDKLSSGNDLPLAIQIPCNIVRFGQELSEFSTQLTNMAENAQIAFGATEQTPICGAEPYIPPTAGTDWARSCSSGYCTYNYQGRQLVVNERGVFEAAPQEGIREDGGSGLAYSSQQDINRAIHGTSLVKFSCESNRQACANAIDAYDQYQAQVRNQISSVVDYDEFSATATRINNAKSFIDAHTQDRNRLQANSQRQAADIGNIAGDRQTLVLQTAEQGVRTCIESGSCSAQQAQNAALNGQLVLQEIEDSSERVAAEEKLRAYGETFYQSISLEEEMIAAREELDTARQEADAYTEFLKAQLMLNDYGGSVVSPSAVRMHVNAMKAYGRLGSIIGAEGWGDAARATEKVREFVGKADFSNQFAQQFCEDKGQFEQQERAVLDDGRAGARISAVAARQGDSYDYIISYFIRAQGVQANQITVSFDGQPALEHTPTLGQPVNYGVQSPRRHQRVCITFPERLGNYYDIDFGINPNSRELCARVEVLG